MGIGGVNGLMRNLLDVVLNGIHPTVDSRRVLFEMLECEDLRLRTLMLLGKERM